MKWPCEMLQNLTYFIYVYENPNLLFAFFISYFFISPLINAMEYVDIDHSLGEKSIMKSKMVKASLVCRVISSSINLLVLTQFLWIQCNGKIWFTTIYILLIIVISDYWLIFNCRFKLGHILIRWYYYQYWIWPLYKIWSIWYTKIFCYNFPRNM